MPTAGIVSGSQCGTASGTETEPNRLEIQSGEQHTIGAGDTETYTSVIQHSSGELRLKHGAALRLDSTGTTWWQPYVTEENVVDTEGLRAGVDDWRMGGNSNEQLRRLIDSWRTDTPVDEHE